MSALLINISYNSTACVTHTDTAAAQLIIFLTEYFVGHVLCNTSVQLSHYTKYLFYATNEIKT